MRLLEEKSVAAVPGNAFGESGDGFLRCCYATAFEELKTAMNRIEAFAKRLG
jgi:aminotransferase